MSQQTDNEDQVIESLKEAISQYRATFTCGGSIPIKESTANQYSENHAFNGSITVPPVIIRWDGHNGAMFGKVMFPVQADENDLALLLKNCTPATFGLDGKDVLDESYRRAGKLDNTQFSTNFNPYDFGIVDAITQALLPTVVLPVKTAGNTSPEHCGIVAELYKLNVYSGPSGVFKAHVDTPRGATQFGSLVVCLPHPFEGGELAVSHADTSVIFDWTNKEKINTHAQWAAFYSDCKHEVLQVNSGHRITLSYNLYISEHIGGVARKTFPTADPTRYPLYEPMKAVLANPQFMKEGNMLAFPCAHRYAHTEGSASRRLPYALKGVDIVIYATCLALGLEVRVRPVVDAGFYKTMMEGKANLDKNVTYVGKRFQKLNIINRVDEGGEWSVLDEMIHKTGSLKELYGVKWVGEKKYKKRIRDRPREDTEPALAFMTYGNEPHMEFLYSYAAIFVTIPSLEERMTKSGAGSSVLLDMKGELIDEGVKEGK